MLHGILMIIAGSSILAYLTGPQRLIVLAVGVLIFGRRVLQLANYFSKSLPKFKTWLHRKEEE